MKLCAKDRRALQFVSEFLSQVTHVLVTIPLLIAAAQDKDECFSQIWGVLIDLILLYASDFPDEPKKKLCKFWRMLADEGHAREPLEGANAWQALQC